MAVFHSDFSDMQLQFDVDPNNLAIVQSYNAGKATVEGAEFEFLFAPANDLTLGVDDTVLSTDMKTVMRPAGHDLRSGVNPLLPVSGGRQRRAVVPRAVRAEQRAECRPSTGRCSTPDAGNLELYLNYRYQGRQYDTAPTGVNVPGSTSSTPSRPTGCSTAGSPGTSTLADSKKTMKFSIWAKNLTNKQYQAHVIGQGAAPIMPVLELHGPGDPADRLHLQRDGLGAGTSGRSPAVPFGF